MSAVTKRLCVHSMTRRNYVYYICSVFTVGSHYLCREEGASGTIEPDTMSQVLFHKNAPEWLKQLSPPVATFRHGTMVGDQMRSELESKFERLSTMRGHLSQLYGLSSRGGETKLGLPMADQLRELMKQGHNPTINNSYDTMKELCQISADELSRGGVQTMEQHGTIEQMRVAWESVTRTMSYRDDYSSSAGSGLILEKMELFEQVYKAMYQEYTKQMTDLTYNDLYQPITKSEGRIGYLFGPRLRKLQHRHHRCSTMEPSS